jgi:hypothetical protein
MRKTLLIAVLAAFAGASTAAYAGGTQGGNSQGHNVNTQGQSGNSQGQSGSNSQGQNGN